MKSNFALKLSNDGIELIHRAADGWRTVGAVSFTTDDVAQGCADLVARAQALEPEGYTSKLILPDSELRYEVVNAPGPTDEARRYQIEAEIEALTPYSIDELVYDWSVEDDHALVVFGARETLSEAETFADGYGFNPVSFVAIPESGRFNGEPYFGETICARAHLPKGQTISRDAQPVRVIGSVPAATAAAPATHPEPAAPAPEAAQSKTMGEGEATVGAGRDGAADAPPRRVEPPKETKAPIGAASDAGAAPRPTPPATARPVGAPTARAPAAEPQQPLAKVGGLVRRMSNKLRGESADPAAAPQPAPGAVSAPSKPVQPSSEGLPPGRKPADRAADPAKAPLAAKPVVPAARPVPTATTQGDTDSASQPASPKPAEAPVSFASRRAPASGDAPARPLPAERPSDRPIDRPAPAGSAGPRPQLVSSRPAPAGADAAGPNPGGRLAMMGDAQERPSLPVRLFRKTRRLFRRTRRKITGQPGPAAAAALAAQTAAGRAQINTQTNSQATARPVTRPAPGSGPSATQPATSGPRAIVPSSVPPSSPSAKVSEAEALTIFGARGQAQQNSGARTGLLAVGGVLLLLIAVGVWALYFRGGSDDQQLARVDITEASGAGGSETAVAANAGGQGSAPIEAPETASIVTDPAALPDSAAPATDAIAALPDSSGVTDAIDSVVSDVVDDTLADLPDNAGDATAALTGDADVPTTDPDALLETLVAEALSETPVEAALPDTSGDLESATQEIAETDDATDLAAVTPDAQTATAVSPSVGVAGADSGATDQLGAVQPGTDTPQLAATQTVTQRLALPSELAVPTAPDAPFAPPAPPPPPGAEFTFDERGLVPATPEGALTPSGITVTAGRPEAVPSTRPGGLVSQAQLDALAAERAAAGGVTAGDAGTTAPAVDTDAAVAAAIAPVEQALPDDTPQADPALAGFRPQPRSESVRAIGERLRQEADEAATETATEAGQQDAALLPDPSQPETGQPATAQPEIVQAETTPTDTGDPVGAEAVQTAAAALDPAFDADAPPPGGVSLAGLRPQQRPTDLVPAALIPDPLPEEVSEQAVAQSLVPNRRPADLAERAQAVLAAAQQAGTATASAGSSDRPEDVETDEGETIATARVSIPTSADVARNATETNALRLNRTNLIGVFGSPSSPRALVRLASGRVVRVSVGDRLDGGRVTAIGDGVLRYTSGGRETVLEIDG